MTKTNLNTAIVAHIGGGKTSAQEIAFAQHERKTQTIEEISKKELSYKIKPLPSINKIPHNYKI